MDQRWQPLNSYKAQKHENTKAQIPKHEALRILYIYLMQRQIHKIDAGSKSLGRLASEIAWFLCGKDEPTFERHKDTGGFVEVFNFGKVKITGNKIEQKKYYRHSGYPHGLKEIKLKDLIKTNPEKVLKEAVYGMLPKNNLRAKMIKRLTVKT